MVRTIGSIKGWGELNLPRDILNSLKQSGVSAEEIVTRARKDMLTGLPHIGYKQAQVITGSLERAGFFYHEPPRSAAFRDLFVTIGMYEDFGSTQEYESRKPFSEQEMWKTLEVLRKILSEFEYSVIGTSFGLETGQPHNNTACSRVLKVTPERAIRTRELALYKLKAFAKHGRFWKAIAGEPVVTELPFKERKKVYAISVTELPLPTRVIKALQHLRCETVGDICQLKRAELQHGCNIAGVYLDQIEAYLTDHGVSLAK